MRPTADQPRRPRRAFWLRGRGRYILIGAVVVILILLVSLRGAAHFYTDFLWFRSLHLTGVWTGVLGAKLVLAAIFIALFFGLLFANLVIADRIAPTFVPGPDEELVKRYHDLVGRRRGLVRVVVSLVFALVAGAGVSSQWNDWILFTHARSFGVKDATFHTDVGFYVFKLPFLSFLGSWLFAAFIIIFIVTAVAHYLNGGIRVRAPKPEVGPQVKAHLSVLLAVLALIKGYQYWLQRYQLTFSHRGTVDGALYTDTNVELKALYLLVLIAVFALVLFIVNIWRRGWVLPVIAVGLWALVAVLAGAVVPAFVQRFRVKPSESHTERTYIRHNVDATRRAIGLDKVKVQSFNPNQQVDVAGLQANAPTVRNIRLWDPAVMRDVFQKLQAQQAYYEISDVDIDRYTLAGDELTQVMLGTRDLDRSNVPQNSWEATHLGFTHGYGTIMSPANATDAQHQGQPDFVQQDIPVHVTNGGPDVKQPDIYFGEGLSGYVMVNTERSEVDYTDKAGNTRLSRYHGDDGIKVGGGIGGFVKRASFALRFGDINPLISSNVRAGSKILINRDVSQRLRAAAPFLSWDSDPYPVSLADGRVVYIVDGYTTTKHYPNAQTADVADIPTGSGLDHDFNYVRNSVKAVVDAYDGTVKLYVVDDSDPLIQAYRSAFPKLFVDGSKASKDLRAHFRYPEDLFRVQTAMYGRYRLTDPDAFYSKSNAWDVALDPNFETTGRNATSVATENGRPPKDNTRMAPYYLLMKLPGQDKESFVQLRPFTPVKGGGLTEARQQLTGFMVAQSDPSDYGHLVVYRTPTSNLPEGPRIVAGDMARDPNVSEQQTLLCAQGSQCTFGSTFLLPIGNSLLYVRSQYVAGSNNGVPQLSRVIVASTSGGSSRVAIDPTLYGALSRLVCPGGDLDYHVAAPDCGLPQTREANFPTNPSQPGQKPATPTSPTKPQAPTSPQTPTSPQAPGGLSASDAAKARDVTGQIQAALQDGRAAFGRGDYDTWAKDQAKVDDLTKQLQALLGSAAPSPSSTTPGSAPSGPSGAPPAASPPTTKPAQPTTTLSG